MDEDSAYYTAHNTFTSAEYDNSQLPEHDDPNELSKRLSEFEINRTPFMKYCENPHY